MGAFTLVEAMVVIAISAILMSLAVPSMRKLIESNGITDSVDSLTGSIAFARAESIKRGVPVTMCSSSAATTGTMSCGGAWSAGWIVFVDHAGDAAVATKDTVLRVQGSFEKNGSISSTASDLVFKPTGTMANLSARFEFMPPSASKSPSKVVCVLAAGRVRVVDGGACS